METDAERLTAIYETDKIKAVNTHGQKRHHGSTIHLHCLYESLEQYMSCITRSRNWELFFAHVHFTIFVNVYSMWFSVSFRQNEEGVDKNQVNKHLVEDLSVLCQYFRTPPSSEKTIKNKSQSSATGLGHMFHLYQEHVWCNYNYFCARFVNKAMP